MTKIQPDQKVPDKLITSATLENSSSEESGLLNSQIETSTTNAVNPESAIITLLNLPLPVALNPEEVPVALNPEEVPVTNPLRGASTQGANTNSEGITPPLPCRLQQGEEVSSDKLSLLPNPLGWTPKGPLSLADYLRLPDYFSARKQGWVDHDELQRAGSIANSQVIRLYAVGVPFTPPKVSARPLTRAGPSRTPGATRLRSFSTGSPEEASSPAEQEAQTAPFSPLPLDLDQAAPALPLGQEEPVSDDPSGAYSALHPRDQRLGEASSGGPTFVPGPSGASHLVTPLGVNPEGGMQVELPNLAANLEEVSSAPPSEPPPGGGDVGNSNPPPPGQPPEGAPLRNPGDSEPSSNLGAAQASIEEIRNSDCPIREQVVSIQEQVTHLTSRVEEVNASSIARDQGLTYIISNQVQDLREKIRAGNHQSQQRTAILDSTVLDLRQEANTQAASQAETSQQNALQIEELRTITQDSFEALVDTHDLAERVVTLEQTSLTTRVEKANLAERVVTLEQNTLDPRVDTLALDQTSLTSRVDTLEQTTRVEKANLAEGVDTLALGQNILTGRVDTLQQENLELKTNLATRVEKANLAEGVDTLALGQNILTGRVDTLQQTTRVEQANLAEGVGTLVLEQISLTSRVDTLEQTTRVEQTSLTSRVDTLEQTSLTTRVEQDNLAEGVGTLVLGQNSLTARVNALTSREDTVAGDITNLKDNHLATQVRFAVQANLELRVDHLALGGTTLAEQTVTLEQNNLERITDINHLGALVQQNNLERLADTENLEPRVVTLEQNRVQTGVEQARLAGRVVTLEQNNLRAVVEQNTLGALVQQNNLERITDTENLGARVVTLQQENLELQNNLEPRVVTLEQTSLELQQNNLELQNNLEPRVVTLEQTSLELQQNNLEPRVVTLEQNHVETGVEQARLAGRVVTLEQISLELQQNNLERITNINHLGALVQQNNLERITDTENLGAQVVTLQQEDFNNQLQIEELKTTTQANLQTLRTTTQINLETLRAEANTQAASQAETSQQNASQIETLRAEAVTEARIQSAATQQNVSQIEELRILTQTNLETIRAEAVTEARIQSAATQQNVSQIEELRILTQTNLETLRAEAARQAVTEAATLQNTSQIDHLNQRANSQAQTTQEQFLQIETLEETTQSRFNTLLEETNRQNSFQNHLARQVGTLQNTPVLSTEGIQYVQDRLVEENSEDSSPLTGFCFPNIHFSLFNHRIAIGPHFSLSVLGKKFSLIKIELFPSLHGLSVKIPNGVGFSSKAGVSMNNHSLELEQGQTYSLTDESKTWCMASVNKNCNDSTQIGVGVTVLGSISDPNSLLQGDKSLFVTGNIKSEVTFKFLWFTFEIPTRIGTRATVNLPLPPRGLVSDKPQLVEKAPESFLEECKQIGKHQVVTIFQEQDEKHSNDSKSQFKEFNQLESEETAKLSLDIERTGNVNVVKIKELVKTEKKDANQCVEDILSIKSTQTKQSVDSEECCKLKLDITKNISENIESIDTKFDEVMPQLLDSLATKVPPALNPLPLRGSPLQGLGFTHKGLSALNPKLLAPEGAELTKLAFLGSLGQITKVPGELLDPIATEPLDPFGVNQRVGLVPSTLSALNPKLLTPLGLVTEVRLLDEAEGVILSGIGGLTFQIGIQLVQESFFSWVAAGTGGLVLGVLYYKLLILCKDPRLKENIWLSPFLFGLRLSFAGASIFTVVIILINVCWNVFSKTPTLKKFAFLQNGVLTQTVISFLSESPLILKIYLKMGNFMIAGMTLQSVFIKNQGLAISITTSIFIFSRYQRMTSVPAFIAQSIGYFIFISQFNIIFRYISWVDNSGLSAKPGQRLQQIAEKLLFPLPSLSEIMPTFPIIDKNKIDFVPIWDVLVTPLRSSVTFVYSVIKSNLTKIKTRINKNKNKPFMGEP